MDAFAATFRTRPRDEWFAVLGQADACLTPVLELDEMAADPHVRERGLVETIEDPEAGTVEQVGVAPRLLGTPGEVRLHSARLGEHTDAVLGSLGLEAVADRGAAWSAGWWPEPPVRSVRVGGGEAELGQ